MVPVYTGDRLLATLCGGVICGIGDALIYMQNSSTGGIDFITMAVKVKHPHLPFGNITFAAALAVIAVHMPPTIRPATMAATVRTPKRLLELFSIETSFILLLRL